MKSIAKYIVLFLFIPVGVFANSGEIDTLIARANNEYKLKNFQNAVELYQSVVDSGYHSYELYYNIGNGYFKQGDIARAILNYERALLLNPTDEDVNFNLSKSQTYVVDKIEVIPEFFFKTWFRKMVVMLSSDTWGIITIVLFVIAMGGFLLFFLSRKPSLKKLVFAVSVLLTFSFILCGVMSVKSRNYIENSQSAIVMTPTVTVKSSPDSDGIDVFIIHEGSKVNILRSLTNWYEISIADGKQGWLKQSDIEKI